MGLIGPGLRGWKASQPLLAGSEPYIASQTVVTASDLLPPAERRRTGVPVKIAMAVASEACANAGLEPASMATVFTSSGGDGDNVHAILEALASTEREVSPTRFHNSVHNAAAGYWSIATQSREPSTSLCCYDISFAAGLLEAATQTKVDQKVAALIAYDHPYPEPFHSKRSLSAVFGAALILLPEASSRTLARLDVALCGGTAQATTMADPELEKLRKGVPAARSLPLLAAIARRETDAVVFEYAAANHLRAAVSPC